MIQRKYLGKLTLLLFVAASLSFTGIQSVTASQDQEAKKPPCRMMKKDCPMGEEMMQNRDAFLKETKELRKNMMVKRSEMEALMQGTNPNPEQVAVLAGELFDLKEQLREKAQEKGLPGHGLMGPHKMGHGCDMMRSGDGPMMKGRHHGQ